MAALSNLMAFEPFPCSSYPDLISWNQCPEIASRLPMLSAKELLLVDPVEDTVPQIVHLGRWCQMCRAIASKYSLWDRLHVQYEPSLLVPRSWNQASKTSSSPFVRINYFPLHHDLHFTKSFPFLSSSFIVQFSFF